MNSVIHWLGLVSSMVGWGLFAYFRVRCTHFRVMAEGWEKIAHEAIEQREGAERGWTRAHNEAVTANRRVAEYQHAAELALENAAFNCPVCAEREAGIRRAGENSQ